LLSPALTSSTIVSIETPFASGIASVHPSELPVSRARAAALMG
jgi:hypothetical protein